MVTIVRVHAGAHLSVRLFAKTPGNNIDDATDGLGTVENTLPALEYLNPFNHVCGNRVERHGRVVKPVCNAYAVDQPQNVLAPRSLQRS